MHRDNREADNTDIQTITRSIGLLKSLLKPDYLDLDTALQFYQAEYESASAESLASSYEDYDEPDQQQDYGFSINRIGHFAIGSTRVCLVLNEDYSTSKILVGETFNIRTEQKIDLEMDLDPAMGGEHIQEKLIHVEDCDIIVDSVEGGAEVLFNQHDLHMINDDESTLDALETEEQTFRSNNPSPEDIYNWREALISEMIANCSAIPLTDRMTKYQVEKTLRLIENLSIDNLIDDPN